MVNVVVERDGVELYDDVGVLLIRRRIGDGVKSVAR